MTLERGTLLHKRYRIVEILGQGGMGSVYRAVDENLGVEVAVKENLFTTDEYARQFRLEAVILANLRHPNLPRVTDHFVIGDQGQYLVMDYIEGEDLRQRMERQSTIPEEEAILIGAAMCDALAYLHSRKPTIIHRDIKPGNVKITSTGEIYLVDFGLAKVVQGSQATTTGARAMTPGYSPPEQYGTARTDSRTDVYSLGATLYAALTGIIPEDGLARAMDNAELTPIRRRNPKVSRRLAAAVEKAMAVKSEDRFQTADEFKKALLSSNSKTQRVMSDFVVPPAPEIEEQPGDEKNNVRIDSPQISPITPPSSINTVPPSQPPSQPILGKDLGCGPIALVVISLVIVISLFFAFNSKLRASVVGIFIPSPTPSPTPTQIASTPTPLESRTSTPTLTLTPRPSSTPTPTNTPTVTPTPLGGSVGQIAFVSNRTGVAQLYVINVDGSNLHPITNVPDGACQPSWSPDGKRLVFISPCAWSKEFYQTTYPDSTLYTIRADGTGLQQLLTEPGGDFDPAWSPDGKHIAFTSLRDGYMQIYSYNLTDQSLVRLTETPKNEETRQPAWSPSSNQLLYVLKRFGAYQIFAMTDLGQNPIQIARRGTQYWDLLPAWAPDGETIYFSERPSDGPTQPWLMTIGYEERGTEGERVSIANPPILDVDVSPDGSWMAYEGIVSSNNDIFLLNLTDGETKRLTKDPGNDWDPTWRPSPP